MTHLKTLCTDASPLGTVVSASNWPAEHVTPKGADRGAADIEPRLRPAEPWPAMTDAQRDDGALWRPRRRPFWLNHALQPRCWRPLGAPSEPAALAQPSRFRPVASPSTPFGHQ